MGLLFNLIIVVVFGVVAAAIASSKGRSVVGWFFGGFFLGLIGVIIVAVLPNKKAEEERWRQSEMERRRLREQLRQERYKHEALRRYNMARLDAHDDALGLDTKGLQPALVAEARPNLPAGEDEDDPIRALAAAQQQDLPMSQIEGAPDWWYERQGRRQGPTTEARIREMIAFGEISPETLLWSEPLGRWTRARDVALFANEWTA